MTLTPLFTDSTCPLPQAGLPADPGILRAAARHTQVNVGVSASVLQGGTMRPGDAIRVE